MGGCTGCAALNSLPLNTKSATSGFHDDRGGGSSGPGTAHTQLPTLPSPLLMQIKQDANMAVDTLSPRTLAFWRLLWHGAALQLPTILLFRLSTPPRPPLPYHPRPHRHSPPHTMNTQVGTPVCTSITTTTAHRLGTTRFVTFPNFGLVMLSTRCEYSTRRACCNRSRRPCPACQRHAARCSPRGPHNLHLSAQLQLKAKQPRAASPPLATARARAQRHADPAHGQLSV